MRKLIMAINVSLDGYADHTAGVASDELHDFFTNLLDETGLQLFGRFTYQLMESYWPHVHEDPNASKSDLDFADKFNAVPKIVFSSTLEKAEWKNTTLVKSNALEYVAKLKETEGKPLFVGGIKLAGSLMSHGLVDEYWVLVHPLVVGQGRRLFENVNENFHLRLLESKVFKSGVVALHYASADQ
ncbi:MAG: dihydrofolate reductase family protein [Bdellovibrionaceae bacterium]|nr:dihydrofolate reductase family protein [Pseudobdellovibrionaceae bacterium]